MSLWQRLFKPKMTAIGFAQADDAFSARQIKQPTSTGHDILVKVTASAVNPVDVKMKTSYIGDNFRVLGFDAVGEVLAIGDAVTRFAVGERVFYAGSQLRAGSQQDVQLVDERLVGFAPVNLSDEQAAALPLTSLTAYEMLTEAFELPFKAGAGAGKTILIINGAGGVGSILIQLAKYLGLTVIATASRPNSVAWVEHLGADFVLNHHQNLTEQLTHLQLAQVDYVAILADTAAYWEVATTVIAPFGRIASIVETDEPLPLNRLKNIGAQFKWVFMFAKGNYEHEMLSQGNALNEIAALADGGVIESTTSTVYQGLNADNVAKAHVQLQAGHTIGKIVIVHEEEN